MTATASGVHDALHGRDDLVPGRPVGFGLWREVHRHDAVHRGGALGVRQHRVEVHLPDLGKVVHQRRDVDDDLRQGFPVHRSRAPDATEDLRRGHAVQHGQGLVAARRRQPEGHVTQHLHQHPAQPEGHHLAEARIGHRPDDDLHASAGHLLLDLDPGQHRVGLVGPGVVRQGLVGPLRLLVILDPHLHAARLGLVQDVFRDDLHHHREADVRGQLRGFRGRMGHAFPRQRDTVGTQHLAAFQGRQRGASLGLHRLQHGTDITLSARSCLHGVGPPCLSWCVGHPSAGGTRVNAPARLSCAISSAP